MSEREAWGEAWDAFVFGVANLALFDHQTGQEAGEEEILRWIEGVQGPLQGNRREGVAMTREDYELLVRALVDTMLERTLAWYGDPS